MTTFADLPQPFGRAEARVAGINDRRIERAAHSVVVTRIAPSLYAVRSGWTELTP